MHIDSKLLAKKIARMRENQKSIRHLSSGSEDFHKGVDHGINVVVLILANTVEDITKLDEDFIEFEKNCGYEV